MNEIVMAAAGLTLAFVLVSFVMSHMRNHLEL